MAEHIDGNRIMALARAWSDAQPYTNTHENAYQAFSEAVYGMAGRCARAEAAVTKLAAPVADTKAAELQAFTWGRDMAPGMTVAKKFADATPVPGTAGRVCPHCGKYEEWQNVTGPHVCVGSLAARVASLEATGAKSLREWYAAQDLDALVSRVSRLETDVAALRDTIALLTVRPVGASFMTPRLDSTGAKP